VDLSSQNVFSKEPVITTSEQKRQKKLILILVGAVVATAGVVYFGFSFTSPAPTAENSQPTTEDVQETMEPLPASPEEQTPVATDSDSVSAESITLDFSVLDDPKFQSLKKFGGGLDTSGPKGRSNPFVPY
jgi:flagellar basal body-associated protein FliL